jgi:hypothetical protein
MGAKSSELATPYCSRTAFASSVRPSASRASATTLALSLAHAWSFQGPCREQWCAPARLTGLSVCVGFS